MGAVMGAFSVALGGGRAAVARGGGARRLADALPRRGGAGAAGGARGHLLPAAASRGHLEERAGAATTRWASLELLGQPRCAAVLPDVRPGDDERLHPHPQHLRLRAGRTWATRASSVSRIYFFGGIVSFVTLRLAGPRVDKFGAFRVGMVGAVLGRCSPTSASSNYPVLAAHLRALHGLHDGQRPAQRGLQHAHLARAGPTPCARASCRCSRPSGHLASALAARPVLGPCS